MEHDSDIRKLMQKALGGDREAFGQIFTHLYTPLFRYLYSRTGSQPEAEDLTQQVFIRAYTALPRFKLKPQPPRAFFFRIAKNILIDFYRKKKAVLVDDVATLDLMAGADQRTNQVEINQDIDRVKKAMKSLTPDQIQVIELRFFSQLSHDEIAVIIKRKPEAVRALQSRALKALREQLAD